MTKTVAAAKADAAATERQACSTSGHPSTPRRPDDHGRAENGGDTAIGSICSTSAEVGIGEGGATASRAASRVEEGSKGQNTRDVSRSSNNRGGRAVAPLSGGGDGRESAGRSASDVADDGDENDVLLELEIEIPTAGEDGEHDQDVEGFAGGDVALRLRRRVGTFASNGVAARLTRYCFQRSVFFVHRVLSFALFV